MAGGKKADGARGCPKQLGDHPDELPPCTAVHATTYVRRRVQQLEKHSHSPDLLELAAGEALRPEVPEDEVVVGAARGHGVALADEERGEGLGVALELLHVGFELGGHHLAQLRGDPGDLVLVGAALQGREHGLVDLGAEAALVLAVEENNNNK